MSGDSIKTHEPNNTLGPVPQALQHLSGIKPLIKGEKVTGEVLPVSCSDIVV